MRDARLSFTRKSQLRRRPPARPEEQDRTPRRCRPHPYLPYRSPPGNKGAYALCRIEGDTAHFLMVTFWESEVAICAFARDDISVAKYYDFDKNLLLELELCSAHYEPYDW